MATDTMPKKAPVEVAGSTRTTKGIRLWLDDKREAPKGWLHVKTVEEAQKVLLEGNVVEASFDHDLGSYPCDGANQCWTDQGLVCGLGCPCKCHHKFPDGTELAKWMMENNVWPKTMPKVHSQNTLGAKYMLDTFKRYFPKAR